MNISHIQVFCRARLYKETGNEIVISSAQCPIICRDLLVGRTPVIQTGSNTVTRGKDGDEIGLSAVQQSGRLQESADLQANVHRVAAHHWHCAAGLVWGSAVCKCPSGVSICLLFGISTGPSSCCLPCFFSVTGS